MLMRNVVQISISLTVFLCPVVSVSMLDQQKKLIDRHARAIDQPSEVKLSMQPTLVADMLRKGSIDGLLPLIHQALKHGADIHSRDAHGLSPLHYAAAGGHVAILGSLVSSGANIFIGDAFDFTPLHYAALNGSTTAAKYLVRHGASVNTSGAYDIRPIHHAAVNGHAHVIRFLLRHGADINARVDSGLTALHYAAYRNRLDVVRFLLAHGIDPLIKDNIRGIDAAQMVRAVNNTYVAGIIERAPRALKAATVVSHREIDSFMLGTHERVGEQSPVQKLSQHTLCTIAKLIMQYNKDDAAYNKAEQKKLIRAAYL